MWEVQLTESYFDIENEWAGTGYPVSLESKFGDTEAVLTEIREFLAGEGDDKPLIIELDEVECLWNESRQDPSKSYELTLRTDDYQGTDQSNDEFEGTIRLQLCTSYNVEKAKQKQTPQQNKQDPVPEQLKLF